MTTMKAFIKRLAPTHAQLTGGQAGGAAFVDLARNKAIVR